jgi:hypothetical protein
MQLATNQEEEDVELTEIILKMKKEKQYREILEMFLNLLRIRLRSFLTSVHHSVPGDMNCSDLLSVFSSILKNEVGITILDTKVDQIVTIEDYLETTKNPTQKQLKLHICYTMDLYYQLKDFDPLYLNKEHRKKLSEKIRKQGGSSVMTKNLKFMKPLVQYVTEFKKNTTLARKINPFRSAAVSIPKSVSPILKEYVESKFDEEVSHVQNENENITEMIRKTLELEETKKDLTGAFDVVSPVFSDAELRRRKSFVRYLGLAGIFMLVIGIIFLVQILQFPDAWQVFLMFGIIPIAVFLFCMYIFSNVWRLLL